jgi:hypothetical protein
VSAVSTYYCSIVTLAIVPMNVNGTQSGVRDLRGVEQALTPRKKKPSPEGEDT